MCPVPHPLPRAPAALSDAPQRRSPLPYSGMCAPSYGAEPPYYWAPRCTCRHAGYTPPLLCLPETPYQHSPYSLSTTLGDSPENPTPPRQRPHTRRALLRDLEDASLRNSSAEPTGSHRPRAVLTPPGSMDFQPVVVGGIQCPPAPRTWADE
eukprot:TRINITY_DN785_c0_g1_i4.p4 TRINITY_DN785_c0_g1~~TRINITY_DN785_c0_g1_i4.p4  ORF type:complete len:152 (-),score=16.80 TRINITY_DN785_c0_g1_i4:785-1240(-)